MLANTLPPDVIWIRYSSRCGLYSRNQQQAILIDHSIGVIDLALV
ncbi:hypothetical protein QWJ46_03275 [Rhizobium sp. CBN3]|nr:hypothetical protein [Rhizobium sp. CBN3]MDO3431698.1 hypothetical protein [Rhizobium sp. CBN3]